MRADDKGRMSGKLDRMQVIMSLRSCDEGSPTLKEISDLIVRAVVSVALGEAGPGSEREVVTALLRTHRAVAVAVAEVAEKETVEKDTLRAAEAERLWWHWVREGYVLAYGSADVSDDALPSWPDELPYEFDYEPSLLTRLAACTGYVAGVQAKQVREHYAKGVGL